MYKTYQEAFDGTIDKLVVQGYYGYDKNIGQCSYKSREGNCCAVGINLSDETTNGMCGRYYSPEAILNNFAEEGLMIQEAKSLYDLAGFWLSMQYMHDSYAKSYTKSATRKASELSRQYNINTSRHTRIRNLKRE